MNSEKVKEIKEWLEEESKAYRNEIACRTLNLINELESDRSEMTDKNYKLSLQIIELLDEKIKLKDRIAALEKENARLNKVVKHFQELIEDGKLISSEQLKQFAEKLKRKAIRQQEFIGELAIGDIEYVKTQDIDETLKECINNNG